MSDGREHPDNERVLPTRRGDHVRTGVIRTIAHWLGDDRGDLPVEGRLGSFSGATGWLNSNPLTVQDLRGRVVLVDFWTYTCVNWLRTLPYVRAWAAKYQESGLTVVGVHTPEFGFERAPANVITQLGVLGVEYPVAIDSEYRVWNEFANRFWPAIYLADVDGRIRYHHFGEGEYAQIEMTIQRLLLDAGAANVDMDLVSVEPRGLEVAADWQALRTPETYLGYAQSSGFASEGWAPYDLPHDYNAAAELPLNEWDLTGNWTAARHAVTSSSPGARIAFQFHARDVNLVMGPRTADNPVSFVVTLDGRPLVEARGTDVDEYGRGSVREHGTFQLVRQEGPIADRRFEIEFSEPGVEAFCFTFG